MLEEVANQWFVVLTFGTDAGESIDDDVDKLMEALMDSTLVSDADVTAAGRAGQIEISMYVEAPTQSKAISRAASAVAEAIHRSGGLADGWDELADDAVKHGQYQSTVRPADLAQLC